MSLANNHMFDKAQWIRRNKKPLEQGGVAHFGGYSPTADDYLKQNSAQQQLLYTASP